MISRYALKVGDGFEIDPNATEVLLEIPVAKFSHVGGTVAFAVVLFLVIVWATLMM